MADVAAHELEAVQRRYARLEAVYEVTRRIAGASTIDEVCQAAVDTLLEAVPGRRCSMLLFDDEGVMRFRAWRGISEPYRRAVDGHTPWKPGERGAQAFVVEDVAAATELGAVREDILREGIRSAAFVPLTSRGGVIGKFMIYGAEAGRWDGDEVRLAGLIADHSALAVERIQAEQALKSERALFTAGPVVVFRGRPEPEMPVDYVSPNITQHGYDPEDLTSGRVPFASLLHPDDRARVAAEVTKHLHDGVSAFEQDYRFRTAEGRYRNLHDYKLIVRDAAGRTPRVYGYALDVTERTHLEEQLRHAQKMESIGRLAGGVAHDFNNLLTAITGYAELAQLQTPAGTELGQYIENVLAAAARAGKLTSQLLIFARKQVVTPSMLDLRALVVETERFIRRLIGEDIEITTHASPAAWPVRADGGQIQQVLVNLAVNARDAMPKGGCLAIEVDNVVVDAEHARRLTEIPPGDYVCLAVADTGTGMTDDVRAHLFEPFFTTKEVGRGTGLGLATCYGIVKQCGGAIEVETEVGQGSTFRIYLPRAHDGSSAEVQAARTVARPRTATVMLVEDEPMVRALTAELLKRQGLRVLEAPSADDALATWERVRGEVDLLITDVVMPGKSGRELVRALRAKAPRLRVLYVTGYTSEFIADRDALDEGESLLPKPYNTAVLVERVRELLSS
ncbi:ATP-binding protein [Myxococcota bacterium]|nr:ATP-binding protein [Myxococcota bacterium]